MSTKQNEKSLSNLIETLTIASPIGELKLRATRQALVGISWTKEAFSPQKLKAAKSQSPILTKAAQQLFEYFEGKRTSFDIPLSPQGTDFQLEAWSQLQKIPYGKTISYGEQAKRMGRPSAVRAVGGANGKNPIPIIIPCHRVIGANGKLTGFTGGLDRKETLLKLECHQQFA